jgi:hypothetical protein
MMTGLAFTIGIAQIVWALILIRIPRWRFGLDLHTGFALLMLVASVALMHHGDLVIGGIFAVAALLHVGLAAWASVARHPGAGP